MNNHEFKIGLSFSGGGFRAASFSLGVLTYLNEIKIDDKPALEHVIALSTVSGGTITGAKYAVESQNGEALQTVYKELYSFLTNKDLINESLDRLVSDKNWPKERVKSLINAFADVYDSHLFDGAKFGVLLQDNSSAHLKHISFNATEFASALQFRFQWSEKIITPKADEPERGIIGNNKYHLKESIAKEIRLADILAASSCFPAGFEPINFPTDFVLNYQNDFRNLEEKKQNESDAEFCERINELYPVGLMDGGIVDNQGIEPLLLANKRMLRNVSDKDQALPNAIDLLIISDVASPYMDSYKVSKQKVPSTASKLTPRTIIVTNTMLLIFLLGVLVYAIRETQIGLAIFCTFFSTLSATLYLILRLLIKLPEKFHVPDFFLKPLGKFMKLPLFVYRNLLLNRTNSVLKLLNDVFLKHVRRLNYKRVYEDNSWKNRRIMNAIYELRKGETTFMQKVKSKQLSNNLLPSEKMETMAALAADMGTTLWFSPEEIKSNIPESIIACGQFTMCWNLLEYLEKIERDPANVNPNLIPHLRTMKISVSEHWQNFVRNPNWLLNTYHKSLGLPLPK